MKNVLKFCACCTVVICFFAFNKAGAQCAVVSEDASGNKTAMEVSCDFPVLLDTGNPSADEDLYAQEKTTWSNNNPKGYDLWISAGNNYFELHKADVAAMPVERQKAIVQNPNLYHIIE